MLAAALLGGAVRASTDPIFGLWLVEGEKAIVEIAPCDDSACGRIVWVRKKQDDAASGNVLKASADSARQGGSLCGLQLISGFHQSAPGQWEGGTIYSPRDGHHYSAEMKVRPDGTLGLRGYVLVPAFGSTQVWTKAEDDRGGC